MNHCNEDAIVTAQCLSRTTQQLPTLALVSLRKRHHFKQASDKLKEKLIDSSRACKW